MKTTRLRFGSGFKVVLGNRRAQAATMTIAPGDCEGGPDNRHRGADQWLFVESGTGMAIVDGRRHALRAGSLVLIERGDVHEIRNTGRRPLRTLNIYVPPAYAKSGDELPRGQVALGLAALNGKAEALSRLLPLGVDLDAFTSGFYSHATPLHHAVWSGSLATVKVLVEAGARLTTRDKAQDGTPLGWAEYATTLPAASTEGKQFREIAAYLRERGAR